MIDNTLNYVSQPDTTEKPEKDNTEKPQAEGGADTKPKKPREKYPFARVETELSEMIDGVMPAKMAGYGNWPYTFKVVKREDTDGPLILEITGNDAKIVNEAYLGAKLKEYVRYLTKKARVYNITHRQCKTVAETWAAITQNVLREVPQTLGFADTKDMVLHRHPFTPKPVDREELRKLAPTFSGMLDNMTNSKAYAQRLGSIADPRASRKQAVWVHGKPDCGKSQLAVLLQYIVGNFFVRLNTKMLRSEYWKATLVGKRVGIVNEAPLAFLKSDEFKDITGDNYQSAREPFGKFFQYRCDALLWFFSNNEPKIPNDEALKSRLIVCRMNSIPKEQRISEHVIQENLMKELPHILGYCIQAYAELEGSVSIPCDDEELQEAIDRYEAEFLDFIAHYVRKDSAGFVTRTELVETMKLAGIVYGPDIARCKEVIFERFNCKETRPRTKNGNERPWVIKGISLKRRMPTPVY